MNTLSTAPLCTRADAAMQHVVPRDFSRPISIALQGGGAHGAFSWGVLDRLLENQTLCIKALSGSSAGAMNAVVMADGLARGGHAAARENLHDFWRQVARIGALNPMQPSILAKMLGMSELERNRGFAAFDVMSRFVSPYQFNPGGWHPLREVLRQCVDFDLIRESDECKLFICATNVRSGMPKVFKNAELTIDCVLASAALPFLFHAVEIDDEHYWDGGYMGNPPLYPLVNESGAADLMVVHTNPTRREDVPRSASAIMNRINEISFNATLLREMREIAFISRLIDEGSVSPGRLRRINLHAIQANVEMAKFDQSTKLSADWSTLLKLRDLGRSHADTWLDENFDAIGQHSTVDMGAMFQ